jgi:hypothetical protein
MREHNRTVEETVSARFVHDGHDLWLGLHAAGPVLPPGKPFFAHLIPLPPEAQRGLEKSASNKEDLILRLVPLARELAGKAGLSGVTVHDVRIVAVQRGLLTGEEKGRQLSFLGAVMKRAGLVATSEMRRSPVPKSHGNLGRVWRQPSQ